MFYSILDYAVECWLLLEVVAEKQHLILNSICPIAPCMASGTLIEVVRNLMLGELVVQVAINLEEKVAHTTIYGDTQGVGLQLRHKVDNRMVLPVLGVLLLRAEQ